MCLPDSDSVPPAALITLCDKFRNAAWGATVLDRERESFSLWLKVSYQSLSSRSSGVRPSHRTPKSWLILKCCSGHLSQLCAFGALAALFAAAASWARRLCCCKGFLSDLFWQPMRNCERMKLLPPRAISLWLGQQRKGRERRRRKQSSWTSLRA